MKYVVFFLVFVMINLAMYSQAKFPNLLNFNAIEYLDKAKVKANYDCAKPEKKAFLFFDMVPNP